MRREPGSIADDGGTLKRRVGIIALLLASASVHTAAWSSSSDPVRPGLDDTGLATPAGAVPRAEQCGRSLIGGIRGTLQATDIRCRTARELVRRGIAGMRRSDGKLDIFKRPRIGSFTCRFLNLKPGGSIICEGKGRRGAFFPFGFNPAQIAGCSSRYATQIRSARFSCKVARGAIGRWVGRPLGCGTACSLSGIVEGPNNGMSCRERASGGVRCKVVVRSRRGRITFKLRPPYRSLARTQGYLAQKFRPILFFDSGEHWRPLDIRRFLGEGHQICSTTGCGPLTNTEGLKGYPSDGWIEINGVTDEEGSFTSRNPACNTDNLRDCDGTAASAIYYDASRLSPAGYRYLNYWFFYRFNDVADTADALTSDPLDHEGDWENVAVAIPGNSANPPTFDFVNYGQHGESFNYLRENVACDGPDGDVGGSGTPCGPAGLRVHAFVARGSHATYPDICDGQICNQNATRTPEQPRGGQNRWSRNDDPSALLRFPAARLSGTPWTAGAKNWVDWPGRWGATGDRGSGSPASPGNQATFTAPWESVRCADNNACESRVQNRRVSPGRAAAQCGAWFGPAVRATLCSPRQLGRAVKAQRLGRRGAMRLRVAGKRSRGRVRSASAPGLAQLSGAPLRVGQRLVVRGGVPRDARLFVRARRGTQLTEVRFSGRAIRGERTIITVTASRGRARAARSRPLVLRAYATGARPAPPNALIRGRAR